MRIYLHIGPEPAGAQRLQQVLSDKREQLRAKGVLFPRSPGGGNHTRLFMAATDPEHVDVLRFNRGFADSAAQQSLYDGLRDGLAQEIDAARPETVILSAAQLGASVYRRSEMERLRALLGTFSSDIRILAYLGEPASMLLDHYARQLAEGRALPLSAELSLLQEQDWWGAALARMPSISPMAGQFEETQGPAFWLDYTALARNWGAVFGPGNIDLRGYSPEQFSAPEVTEELRAAFGIADTIGRADPQEASPHPSAATMARKRQFNEILLRYLADGRRHLPRQLWRGLLSETALPGDPPDPAGLGAVSRRFHPENLALAEAHGIDPTLFELPQDAPAWQEAPPERGFRASQYLLAARFRIDKASKEKYATRAGELGTRMEIATPPEPAAAPDPAPPGLSDTARAILPPLAVQKFESLRATSYAPHNRIGAVDEEQLAAAFDPAPPRLLPENRTGNVIVGCMKNEAPYIVEWVAYHRAIGVDNFLIYTNDCTDGTSEILDRLQEMGVLEHRNNDAWKGNSPQQYALNRAMKEPVVAQSDWIIHIDVDEFINVRCGNGTLADFLARVPEATNVAMTWRLFGHNGITRLADDFVIDQFDTCAPKYCPKPHTVWGFKTMFRNIGAYSKLSCHRPNKLDEGFREKVRWVNGSGQDMTGEAVEKGWRSSKKSIGYDLLQLNHYALRSAESFLIKRQRGRALHVDRSIGLNYWIRMDWGDFRDITIKRNLPRLRAEYDRLMQDATLRRWHEKGLDWHRAKAEELHAMPEFEDLYREALKVKLTETERVAYALALDLES